MNRYCTFNKNISNIDIIKNCSILNISNIKKYAEGAYGKIYTGVIYNNKKIAIKINIDILRENNFKRINEEIIYAYKMSNLGLGPNIYDAFYNINKYNEYKQVLIMDFYKYNGIKFLNKYHNNTSKIKIVVQNMIDILKKIIYDIKLYCVDVKPINYVMNNENDVKMIDFDFCNIKLQTDTEDELYQILLFQLYNQIENFVKYRNIIVLIKDVFCKEFKKDLPWILKKYYFDRNLLIKYYLGDKYNYSVCNFIDYINEEKYNNQKYNKEWEIKNLYKIYENNNNILANNNITKEIKKLSIELEKIEKDNYILKKQIKKLKLSKNINKIMELYKVYDDNNKKIDSIDKQIDNYNIKLNYNRKKIYEFNKKLYEENN